MGQGIMKKDHEGGGGANREKKCMLMVLWSCCAGVGGFGLKKTGRIRGKKKHHSKTINYGAGVWSLESFYASRGARIGPHEKIVNAWL